MVHKPSGLGSFAAAQEEKCIQKYNASVNNPFLEPCLQTAPALSGELELGHQLCLRPYCSLSITRGHSASRLFLKESKQSINEPGVTFS